MQLMLKPNLNLTPLNAIQKMCTVVNRNLSRFSGRNNFIRTADENRGKLTYEKLIINQSYHIARICK